MGADADTKRRMAARASTRRPGAAREAARLARLSEGEELRRLASQLATGQRREVLLDLLPELQESEQLELLALLAHELILRMAAYGPNRSDGSLAAGEQGSALGPFLRRLRERQHPLGMLPGYRLPPEMQVSFPIYAATYTAFTRPFAAARRARAGRLAGNSPREVPASRDVATPREAALISAAVAHWQGGRHEARVFRIAEDIAPQDLGPRLLESLQPACLFGASAADVRSTPATDQEAFAELFAAAANGGPHGAPLYGAYGRLAAWQSVSGLLGPTSQVVPEAIVGLAEAMRHAHWLWFEARSDWFSLACDVGLAALRPDHRTVALLAAAASD